MATNEQVKALIKAFADNDKRKFKSIALQVAAYEARQGHAVAEELKNEIDKLDSNVLSFNKISQSNQVMTVSLKQARLTSLVVGSDVKAKIERILDEYKNRNKLYAYGYSNRRKILLEGESGTGKTFNAHFHTLPWPSELLESLGEVGAILKATLSYYIEKTAVEMASIRHIAVYPPKFGW